ncbi:radical SAM protein [Dehalogenimonas etheniformans]|uniref:Radical SAM protein n=1 Tax=Dehalogenimonas etheniformans TaxID=1536648 RepID=A0A2P5P8G2_9CHLR|nr:radical SAM protein [Dehalogenimonas etheniformans]PPD58584.1 radical SAM protein [Dehalogenimonas etheniformans]QNT76652.1 radical SAM protein [Dehalogenimonas etheniformans]
MQTNIYNIAFAESTKQAYIHFWGCNIRCKGCICKKMVYDAMLDRNAKIHMLDPKGVTAPPTRFMDLDTAVKTLIGLNVKSVLLEGQEASLDPAMPIIAKTLHRELGTTNYLLTNAFHMPNLTDIDRVVVGLKALDEKLHIDYTGESNRAILHNFESIYRSGVPMMAESVVIPGYIDAPEIGKIAKFIAGIDKNMRYQIDAYSRVGHNPWRKPTAEEIEEAVAAASKHLTNVHCFKGTELLEYNVKSIFPTEAELDAPELQPAIETREMVAA